MYFVIYTQTLLLMLVLVPRGHLPVYIFHVYISPRSPNLITVAESDTEWDQFAPWNHIFQEPSLASHPFRCLQPSRCRFHSALNLVRISIRILDSASGPGRTDLSSTAHSGHGCHSKSVLSVYLTNIPKDLNARKQPLQHGLLSPKIPQMVLFSCPNFLSHI